MSKKTIFGSNRRKGTGNCKETPALYQNAECVMRNKWVTFKEQYRELKLRKLTELHSLQKRARKNQIKKYENVPNQNGPESEEFIDMIGFTDFLNNGGNNQRHCCVTDNYNQRKKKKRPILGSCQLFWS